MYVVVIVIVNCYNDHGHRTSSPLSSLSSAQTPLNNHHRLFQLSLSPSISSLSSSTLFNYHYHVTSIIFIIIIPQALTFVSSHGIRARPLWLHQDGDGRSNKRKGSTLDDWQPGADKSKERI